MSVKSSSKPAPQRGHTHVNHVVLLHPWTILAQSVDPSHLLGTRFRSSFFNHWALRFIKRFRLWHLGLDLSLDFGGEAAAVELKPDGVADLDLGGVAEDGARGVGGDGVAAFEDL